jgi:hypothetical protein
LELANLLCSKLAGSQEKIGMANVFSLPCMATFYLQDHTEPILQHREVTVLPPIGSFIFIGGKLYEVKGVCANGDTRAPELWVIVSDVTDTESLFGPAIEHRMHAASHGHG